MRSVRIIFQNDFAIALDLNQWISGQDVVREQSRSSMIIHRESEQSVIWSGPIFGEGAGQLPVERSVEKLADSDHYVATNVRNDPQIVGDV